MKEEIIASLDHPHELEGLYRSHKSLFAQSFNAIYPEVKDRPIAQYWHERLNYKETAPANTTGLTWLSVVIASLMAGLIAKLPAIFNINEEYFYSRNIGFVVFPILSAYFAWKNKFSVGKIAFLALAMLAGLVFINFLPDNHKSDSLILSCIHLLLFLWSMLGFAFAGDWRKKGSNRLDFLKYNGDLVVMTTLILIAGGIMSAVTIGLFSLIGIQIEQFYAQNVIVVGLAAAPIVGTYLTQTNPQLVGKVSPVIAKLFSPLVAVMLTIYLVAIVYAGKDPYNDREFLIIFNALLIGVMTIIFFSVAETAKSRLHIVQIWILFVLSILTIIVNGVALSAIIFRIAEFGITPNRMAVVGGNALIFINLVIVNLKLYQVLFRKSEINRVGQSIAAYLPVYVVWTIIVTFIFPLMFGFR